jgi:TonB family protein
MFIAVIFALVAAQSAASASVSTPPTPANGPSGWIFASDYPPEAQRQGLEGSVGFTLAVDAAGAVSGCTVTASSGAPQLDSLTCALLSARARFTPARDAAGSAVAGTYSSRIRWTLPDTGPPVVLRPVDVSNSPAPLETNATIEVDSDGIITRCIAARASYQNVLPPPDICGSYPTGARFGPPTVRNGHPVRRRVVIQLHREDTFFRVDR